MTKTVFQSRKKDNTTSTAEDRSQLLKKILECRTVLKKKEDEIAEKAFRPDIAEIERAAKRQGPEETRRIATKRSKTEIKSCKTGKKKLKWPTKELRKTTMKPPKYQDKILLK